MYGSLICNWMDATNTNANSAIQQSMFPWQKSYPVLDVYPTFFTHIDVENLWLPQENSLQMVDVHWFSASMLVDPRVTTSQLLLLQFSLPMCCQPRLPVPGGSRRPGALFQKSWDDLWWTNRKWSNRKVIWTAKTEITMVMVDITDFAMTWV